MIDEASSCWITALSRLSLAIWYSSFVRSVACSISAGIFGDQLRVFELLFGLVFGGESHEWKTALPCSVPGRHTLLARKDRQHASAVFFAGLFSPSPYLESIKITRCTLYICMYIQYICTYIQTYICTYRPITLRKGARLSLRVLPDLPKRAFLARYAGHEAPRDYRRGSRGRRSFI